MYESFTVFVASLTAANVLRTSVVDDVVVVVVVVVVIWVPGITVFFILRKILVN